jgi:hypothetical protein
MGQGANRDYGRDVARIDKEVPMSTPEERTSTPVSVGRLEAKSHDAPDEVRAPAKTRIEVVRLDGYTIGRFAFQPGWRWSACIQPVVGTASCQNAHVGYAVSGRGRIRLDDGSELAITPGQSYTIPPGHDAWVEGDEPWVTIEVMSAEQFAAPPR